MTDTGMTLLAFAKGPGFEIATVVFLLGLALRIAEIVVLGRKKDVAPQKADGFSTGMKTVLTRSLPGPGIMEKRPVVVVGGYLFHIAFFVTLLFFVPHIQLFQAAFGISWPGLPSPIIEAVAIVGILSMIAVLICRFKQKVRRYLANFDDYLTWLVTFLPLVTGVMAVNKMVFEYNILLAVHILSVELLMVVFPFTKLTHGLTALMARYYAGFINGRKGAST